MWIKQLMGFIPVAGHAAWGFGPFVIRQTAAVLHMRNVQMHKLPKSLTHNNSGTTFEIVPENYIEATITKQTRNMTNVQ